MTCNTRAKNLTAAHDSNHDAIVLSVSAVPVFPILLRLPVGLFNLSPLNVASSSMLVQEFAQLKSLKWAPTFKWGPAAPSTSNPKKSHWYKNGLQEIRQREK